MDRMHCRFPIAGILTAAPYPVFFAGNLILST